ncbi:hypothetical protein [Stackebrandtia soli]|uniref:hypothetical protein n=1 Tax=Stackebrandtia soli TaxID=1892856 RepID=UPI0039EB2D97
MARRDWRSVHNFLSGIQDPDELQHYLNLCANQNGVQAWIDDWIEAEPRSFLPFLVGGAHAIKWAWLGRGTALAKNTLPAQFRIFERRLRKAHEFLTEAISRNPDDPTAWSELIICGRGMGLGIDEAVLRFNQALIRHRWHLDAHKNLLNQLLAKWGGSHELSCQFVEEATVDAPPSSGVSTVVVTAHLEHWVRLESGKDTEYLNSASTIASLRAAADRSVLHPDYRRRLGWQHDFNMFAMPFYQTEQWDLAGEMFDEIGDQITEWPWSFFWNPPGAFVKAQDVVKANRTPRTAS